MCPTLGILNSCIVGVFTNIKSHTQSARPLRQLFATLFLTNCLFVPDTNITIPLNDSLITYDNKEIYGSFYTIDKSSNININFSNISTSLYFIVIQVHSHMFNITFNMFTDNGTSKATAVGKNVGFVNFMDEQATFQLSNHNPNVTILTYISVHGYKEAGKIYFFVLF